MQVKADRNVQGCRVPLIPSTPCLNAVLKRNKVKYEGKNLVVMEVILVLHGYNVHT